MILFIKYYENEFIISGLIENENGIVPLKSKMISLDNYPYLQAKLMEGKILYIDSFGCYLGSIQTEGPYCEEEIFNSEYECHNNEVKELLITIDRNIKEDKQNTNKLTKIGNHYK